MKYYIREFKGAFWVEYRGSCCDSSTGAFRTAQDARTYMKRFPWRQESETPIW